MNKIKRRESNNKCMENSSEIKKDVLHTKKKNRENANGRKLIRKHIYAKQKEDGRIEGRM